MHELLTRPTADLYRSLVAQTSSRVATRFATVTSRSPAARRTCSDSSTASTSTPPASDDPGGRETRCPVPRARRLVPRSGVRRAPQLPGRAARCRHRGCARCGEHLGRHLRPVDGRHAHGAPARRLDRGSHRLRGTATASSPRAARSRTCTRCFSPAEWTLARHGGARAARAPAAEHPRDGVEPLQRRQVGAAPRTERRRGHRRARRR